MVGFRRKDSRPSLPVFGLESAGHEIVRPDPLDLEAIATNGEAVGLVEGTGSDPRIAPELGRGDPGRVAQTRSQDGASGALSADLRRRSHPPQPPLSCPGVRRMRLKVHTGHRHDGSVLVHGGEMPRPTLFIPGIDEIFGPLMRPENSLAQIAHFCRFDDEDFEGISLQLGTSTGQYARGSRWWRVRTSPRWPEIRREVSGMRWVDVTVVGGGILGLATAREVCRRRPRLRVRLMETQQGLGRGQSGHNSGVLHSGIYYEPGSLKARLCRRGRAAMLDYCRAKGIDHRVDGKLLVANSEEEVERLGHLVDRGRENGLVGLRRLSAEETRSREPEVRALEAALVPEAGVLDYREVC